MRRLAKESGQSSLLLMGVAAVVLALALLFGGFGQALGAKSRHQRAADLAAVSAAARMRDDYPRLFEPPLLENGTPNPRHMTVGEYLERARAAAVAGARANEVMASRDDVSFPGDEAFGPTRVRVRVRGAARVKVPGRSRSESRLPVAGAATADFAPTAGGGGAAAPTRGTGGGYDGPLAYRMGKAMRPDVAAAFDRMAAAARTTGLALSINSAFRSDAEQARLFAANPNPKWVAPPGTSLHRYATELDLGPPAAYGWLARNARRFGFIKRYAWEAWHFGFGANPRDVPAQYERGAWEPPHGDHGRIAHGLPSFVPPRYHDPLAAAALRWNVSMPLLAAQLYAESGFNPFARSGAGAQGIAQFMPDTARSYGLRNPFDADAAIMAQAHLMHDLLKQFGSVPLALAAYNAGPGAVRRYGGIPPFAETRAYVTKIMALLGGAGEITGGLTYDVRLVE